MMIAVSERWPKRATTHIEERDRLMSKHSLPHYIRQTGIKLTHDGTYIKVTALYEIKDGLETSAIRTLEDRLSKFSHVPGYRYSIENKGRLT